MSSVKQVQVTFDCTEPGRVARFWAETLGYEAEYDDQDGSAAAQDPTGAGPRLYFQRVPENKVVKNRVHLDVRVGTGLVGESARPHSRQSVRACYRSDCSRTTRPTLPIVRTLVSADSPRAGQDPRRHPKPLPRPGAVRGRR